MQKALPNGQGTGVSTRKTGWRHVELGNISKVISKLLGDEHKNRHSDSETLAIKR